jgi:hypothetical protein
MHVKAMRRTAVDLQNALHPAQVDNDGFRGSWKRIPPKMWTARADRHQRRLRLVGPQDDLLHLFHVPRLDQEARFYRRDHVVSQRKRLAYFWMINNTRRTDDACQCCFLFVHGV